VKYFLYILLCKGNRLYTGITNNLPNRIEMHNSGKGSKFVRANLPFRHIYTEEFENKNMALKREFEIKKWGRERKIKELGLRVT
jgi:putative endonuclease